MKVLFRPIRGWGISLQDKTSLFSFLSLHEFSLLKKLWAVQSVTCLNYGFPIQITLFCSSEKLLRASQKWDLYFTDEMWPGVGWVPCSFSETNTASGIANIFILVDRRHSKLQFPLLQPFYSLMWIAHKKRLHCFWGFFVVLISVVDTRLEDGK